MQLRKFNLFSLVVATTLLLSACAAPPSESEAIVIDEAWVRPAFFEGGTGAAYMKITNNADTSDVLLSASVDFADVVELHETMIMSADEMSDMDDMHDHDMENMEGMGEMAMMSPLENIPLPAGETVALEVGGLHIMLIDIQEIPEVGETVSVVLQFEDAGEIIVEAEVREEAP